MSTAAWGGVYASGSDGSASGQSFDTSYGGGAGGGGHYQQAFQEKVLVPRPWKDYHPAPGEGDDGSEDDDMTLKTEVSSKAGKASSGGGTEKGRGGYKCGRCGQPKKGHICTNKPRLRTAFVETVSSEAQVEVDPDLVLRLLDTKIQGYAQSYGLDQNWRPNAPIYPPSHQPLAAPQQSPRVPLPYIPPSMAPPADTYYRGGGGAGTTTTSSSSSGGGAGGALVQGGGHYDHNFGGNGGSSGGSQQQQLHQGGGGGYMQYGGHHHPGSVPPQQQGRGGGYY